MNKDRILALAELIEKQPHTAISDDSGFNMEEYTHSCGTPACIAGWAVFMARGEKAKSLRFGVSRVAREFLGIEEGTASDLFVWTPGFLLNEITPVHAAATLRHLAETGEVNWEATRP